MYLTIPNYPYFHNREGRASTFALVIASCIHRVKKNPFSTVAKPLGVLIGTNSNSRFISETL